MLDHLHTLADQTPELRIHRACRIGPRRTSRSDWQERPSSWPGNPGLCTQPGKAPRTNDGPQNWPHPTDRAAGVVDGSGVPLSRLCA